jgi:DNA-directed DNA polymerase III PolC
MPTFHFIPLHVHSHYSLLEGVDSPDALLQRAAACGYPALALTDSNNLYGAVAFVEAAQRHGVRPILGSCLRLGRQRCTLLIAETAGYHNLCRVLSRLHLHAPRSLPELLANNTDGLHALIDDPALAEPFAELFGSRLWLEIIRPGRSPAHERALLERGQARGLKPVASVAAHFATPDGHTLLRLLTAARQGTLLDRVPTRSPVTPAHCLAPAEELYHRFRDLPEALVNLDRLARQCRSDVLPRDLVLPASPVPKGETPLGYLRSLCEQGLARHSWTDESATRQRLARELHLITQRDLAGYFLVVHEITREARRRGFGMALRGSAGNSLVCYLLNITNVDPLHFDLPLERFLHPGRLDLPDIDLDFDWRVRDQMLDWVFNHFGTAHTAMISSHLFLQPRSAFREAAKVHGLSNEQISRLIQALDERVDVLGDTSRDGVLGRLPRDFPLEPARWPRLLADARRLLGRPHHLSVHPGGVVLTPRPAEEYVPLQRAAKGVIITQFEKDAAEQVGLVKIDLLGNRALSTVTEARRLVHSLHYHRPAVPAEWADPRTLELLQRGDTLGVNQLESPAMRHLLLQLEPRGLHDVIQVLALIRPGAASCGAKEAFVRRRHRVEPVRYEHPALEPILRDTYGLMLYEDDALRVIQALTGQSAPEADHFRKQVSKHQTADEALQLSRAFLQACGQNGIPRSAAEEVWVQLAKFNSYSFCKSHAVSYGLIAWEAVALKAHYPRCFWVAALNNNQGMYPRRVYIEGAKRAGVPPSLPCVNQSWREFTAEKDGIRTGLAVIHSLPEAVREAILEDRERRGPFRGLTDFRRRVAIGPEALAILIQAGAFDFTEQTRPALLAEAELNGAAVEPPLFAGSDAWPYDWAPSDYSTTRRWREEWARLGFLVGPPLMSLFRPSLPAELADSRSLASRVGQTIRLAGLVAASRHTPTQQGKEMQFVTLEDEWGLVEVTLFPGICPPVAYLEMGPYLVEGTVEDHYGAITVRASRFHVAPLARRTQRRA